MLQFCGPRLPGLAWKFTACFNESANTFFSLSLNHICLEFANLANDLKFPCVLKSSSYFQDNTQFSLELFFVNNSYLSTNPYTQFHIVHDIDTMKYPWTIESKQYYIIHWAGWQSSSLLHFFTTCDHSLQPTSWHNPTVSPHFFPFSTTIVTVRPSYWLLPWAIFFFFLFSFFPFFSFLPSTCFICF